MNLLLLLLLSHFILSSLLIVPYHDDGYPGCFPRQYNVPRLQVHTGERGGMAFRCHDDNGASEGSCLH